MIDIGLISPPTLPYVWGDVEELVEEHGEAWLKVVELQEVLALLCKGELDLWVGTKGVELQLVMVCGWEHHAKRSFYHIMWIGGSGLYSYIKEGLEKIEKYACMMGATEVIFTEGRMGWNRVLERYGYGPVVGMKKNVQTCWRH